MTTTLVDSKARFGRRQRRRLARAWRPWLVTAAVVVVIALVAWVVEFSSVLGVRSVDVHGTGSTISRARVLAAADVATGTPLARVDLGAVVSRVEALPPVAAATASRTWPHTLVLTVTPRIPVAEVQRGSRWWAMDGEGVLFDRTASAPAGRPIVDVPTGAGADTLRQVGLVLVALPKSLLTQTKRLSAASVDSITLWLRDGSKVRWGGAADSRLKVRVLGVLMHHSAAVYDVSIPTQPATLGKAPKR